VDRGQLGFLVTGWLITMGTLGDPIHSRRVALGVCPCAILTEELLGMDLVRGKRLERSDH
jgi:hypothetical protein